MDYGHQAVHRLGGGELMLLAQRPQKVRLGPLKVYFFFLGEQINLKEAHVHKHRHIDISNLFLFSSL